MKTIFLAMCILQSPTGGDMVKTRSFTDRGACENFRVHQKGRGLIVGDKCAKVNYSVVPDDNRP